jgi:Uma2 family endonuclease
MTVAEFLRWEDGTGTRYELLGGAPVAMTPPSVAHGMLSARLCGAFAPPLRCRRPGMAHVTAAIAVTDRDDTCYIADLAVASRPPHRGQQLLSGPLLVIEVLCRGTVICDRQTKVADYRCIRSVREILLVDSASVCRGP